VKAISGKALATLLEKKGWVLQRTQGSHHIYVKARTVGSTIVPVHAGEAIGPGLLGKILRDCDLTRERLQELF